MRHFSISIILLLFLIACGNKATDLSGNTPIKIDDFKNIFKPITLPTTISDTNFTSFIDTFKIERKALAQFIPDSIIAHIINIKNKRKAIIHPLLKIIKENEYYLLLTIEYQNKHDIVVLVFNKKNKYLDYKMITEFEKYANHSTKFIKTITINREPSFLIDENSLSTQGNVFYEKKGWAFSDGNFRLIYYDSNKQPEKKIIINPIEAAPTKNIYSANYGADAKNFIALRDNGAPNKYQFFIHFENDDNNCSGELKGLLQFKNNTATYSEKGDACIVQFTIIQNEITIKENGNCGNHRGVTCDFNNKFDRIKKSKAKK
jgi:hypothetical protein